jgi:DNA-binding MarR family transcriptional regulator
MNPSRQVPSGEPVDPDPIGAIEAALVTMRRDQGRRRLQRRAEREGTGRWGDGPEAPDFGSRGGGPGPWGGGRHHRGGPHGDGHGHDHDAHAHDHDGHDHGPGHGPHAMAHAARFRLLDALEASDRPLSVSELADEIGVDQPRASRLVQAAVHAGHVRREADPADARRSALVLTSAGRDVLASARTTRRGAVETALTGFSAEETAEFARLLSRFVAAWPRD